MHRSWVPEPGLWFHYFGDGPEVEGVKAVWQLCVHFRLAGDLGSWLDERSALEGLLGGYRGYLAAERSLTGLTVIGYMKTAARFATACFDEDTAGCAEMSARELAASWPRAGVGYKPKTVNNAPRCWARGISP